MADKKATNTVVTKEATEAAKPAVAIAEAKKRTQTGTSHIEKARAKRLAEFKKNSKE